MSARRVTAVVAVILLAIAYVGGYWPEHRHRVTLEGEVATLRARLADAEARVRMGRLLGDVLSIREAVASLNFGVAQQQSSTLFDSVRAEASVTPVSVFKAALESMLQARDHVTAGLARGDQAAVEPLLRRMELQLREVLGYSVSRSQSTARLPEPRLRKGEATCLSHDTYWCRPISARPRMLPGPMRRCSLTRSAPPFTFST